MQEVIDLFLIPKFNQLGMNATGEWLDNLEIRVINGSGQIWGRDYTEQLVYGRKPGKKPPVAPLEKWVNAKLGRFGAQGRSIAFAVQNKIAKEGTSWYEKGGSDLLEVLTSQEVTDYVNKRIGQEYVKEAILQFQRTIQKIFA